jgi:hypothetical protein
MSDFRKELAETAKKITRPGYGILAADESGPTIGKKVIIILKNSIIIVKSLPELESKILKKTELIIEIYYLPHQDLMNILVESFFLMKLQEEKPLTENPSLN